MELFELSLELQSLVRAHTDYGRSVDGVGLAHAVAEFCRRQTSAEAVAWEHRSGDDEPWERCSEQEADRFREHQEGEVRALGVISRVPSPSVEEPTTLPIDEEGPPTNVVVLQERLERAYNERNELAVAFARAALAAGWTAGQGFDDDPQKSWDAAWRHVVYVDLPTGQQVSWHLSPSGLPLLAGLPAYGHRWDGTFTARQAGWSLNMA